MRRDGALLPAATSRCFVWIDRLRGTQRDLQRRERRRTGLRRLVICADAVASHPVWRLPPGAVEFAPDADVICVCAGAERLTFKASDL